LKEEEFDPGDRGGFWTFGYPGFLCRASAIIPNIFRERFTCHVHWMAAKHMLRYLDGTIGYGLRYVSDGDVKLQGYTNSDWAGSVVDGKSTSGCCFNLGSSMISWLSRKQTSVALSTAEAEYIATSVVSHEALSHSL
jgi:hypothetical protein